MPRSRIRTVADDDLPPAQRSATLFTKADRDKFNKALEGLDRVAIYNAMTKFETAYKASASNADIPGGFQIDQLYAESGAYRVCEVRAGNDYRVAVMFLQRRAQAYWIHPWKKPKMNDRKSVNLAILRAKETWDRIQSRHDRGQ